MEKVTKTVKKTSEAVSLTRGFRSNADVENFYRFVSEHGLRKEAKLVLENILAAMGKKTKKSKKKRAKKKASKSSKKIVQ